MSPKNAARFLSKLAHEGLFVELSHLSRMTCPFDSHRDGMIVIALPEQDIGQVDFVVVVLGQSRSEDGKAAIQTLGAGTAMSAKSSCSRTLVQLTAR